jgi:hypothetical protein
MLILVWAAVFVFILRHCAPIEATKISTCYHGIVSENASTGELFWPLLL